MNGEYIYIDEKTIRLYITKYGKSLLGKDYELGAAVILKNFLERENNTNCLIGIKLNPKFIHLYQQRERGLSVEEIRDLISLHSQENDLVDIAISPVKSFYGNKNSAWVFQLKRFGHFQERKNTEELIEYISKISNKYTKNNAILVFFFDGHKGLSIKKVSEYINSIDFPFPKVMFIGTNDDDMQKRKLQIGELWPRLGYNEYDPRDIIKKMDSI